MPNLSHLRQRAADRLPLQFRVLCHQFLLRVIDLEALSIKADVTAFLGQFSGILIMFSLILSAQAVMNSPTDTEESLFFLTTLAVGLITVVTWDTTFPDRRDVLVLAPLPVKPRTILAAKITASSAVLALAVLALNALPEPRRLRLPRPWLRHPPLLRRPSGSPSSHSSSSSTLPSSPCKDSPLCSSPAASSCASRPSSRSSPSPTSFAASSCCPPCPSRPCLSPSPTTSSPSPRPSGSTPSASTSTGSSPPPSPGSPPAPKSPSSSPLPEPPPPSSSATSAPCARPSKSPTSSPQPAAPTGHPRFGSPLTTAVLLFSLRALTRSRQHRLAFAFYLSIVFAIALGTLKFGILVPAPHPLTQDFLLNTILMMSFAVIGLRSVFSLPISLNANWVLRITQLRPTPDYTAATRTTLLLLAVAPILVASAILSATFRPLHEVAAHLFILLLLGCLLAELSLIGFYKVPFTCSYLPGKSNVQFLFWGFLVLFVPLAMKFVSLEQRAFTHPPALLVIIGSLLALLAALRAFNHHQAKHAAIYFEELPVEVLTTLKLSVN